MTDNNEDLKKILVALGVFTITWSHLHTAMEELVWKILNLDEKSGRALTTTFSTKGLIDLIQAQLNVALERGAIPELKKHQDVIKTFGKILNTLNEKRNDIVHSRWKMDVSKIKSGEFNVTSTRNTAKGKLKTRTNEWKESDLSDLVNQVLNITEAIYSISQTI